MLECPATCQRNLGDSENKKLEYVYFRKES